MKKIEIPQEVIDEIRLLFIQYPSIKKKDICAKFKISNDVLRRIIEENDITTNKDDYVTELSTDKLTKLKDLFDNTDKSLESIRKELNCSYSVMLKYIEKIYGHNALVARKSKLYSLSKLGSNNPASVLKRSKSPKWRGGCLDDGNGYTLVFNDGWMDNKHYDNYVFEHQLVMLKALNIHKMPNHGVIHHINHDRKDNNLDNLVLLSSGAHARIHSLERTYKLSKTDNPYISLDNFLVWLGLPTIPERFEIFYIDRDKTNWQLNNLAVLTKQAFDKLQFRLYS